MVERADDAILGAHSAVTVCTLDTAPAGMLLVRAYPPLSDLAHGALVECRPWL
jgi:hypothetical protein